MKNRLVIAIDGPAGAGKSTVAKRLAEELSLKFLDTGAMYRALALKARQNGITHEDAAALTTLANNTSIEFGRTPGQVLLDGVDVSQEIRNPEISNLASAISTHAGVRKVLATLQRQIVQLGGVTLEGRDTTTVTAFDAPVRIFLTASVEERARRRHADLVASGNPLPIEEVTRQIEERDERDSSREESPLRIAEGVTVINSDHLTIDEVITQIKAIANQTGR